LNSQINKDITAGGGGGDKYRKVEIEGG